MIRINHYILMFFNITILFLVFSIASRVLFLGIWSLLAFGGQPIGSGSLLATATALSLLPVWIILRIQLKTHKKQLAESWYELDKGSPKALLVFARNILAIPII